MYLPKHFREDDTAKLQQYIREYSFGVLVLADDAPADYTDGLIRALVGVEISIQTLSGKLKASQNQPERNREGVKQGLESRSGIGDRAMAKLIS